MTQQLLTPQTTTTDALNAFTNQFNIRYILSSQGIAYFIAQDLSLALNLDKNDFKDNFVRGGVSDTPTPVKVSPSDTPTPVKVSPSEGRTPVSLSDRPTLERLASYLENNSIRLLEQESLKQFKTAYVEQIGPLPYNLKFTSKLYICTLEVAINYISSATTEAHKQLNSILLDATNKQVIQENLQTSSSLINPHFQSEESLHQALAYLSTFGNYRLFSELSLLDISAAKQRHRRLDLTHISYSKGQKYVTIYELKKGQINDITLQDSLAKNYILLAQNHFKTPNVKLIYIAPDYATQPALNLVQYSKEIEIMQLKDFVNLLLKYAARLHKKDPYYIKEMLPKTNTLKALMF